MTGSGVVTEWDVSFAAGRSVQGQVALVLHPDEATQEIVREALQRAGFKVIATGDREEAQRWLEGSRFLQPDVLLAPLASLGGEKTAGPTESGEGSGASLQALAADHQIPALVLGSGDPQERRRALRSGLSHIVPPPFEPEEVVLVTRLALKSKRDSTVLSGSLAQMGAAELLQTAETGRRSGTVRLSHRGTKATVWLRDGRILDAETDGGLRGEEAVFAVAPWEEGTFEADFTPVLVPDRIGASTSSLLLEAMRRLDEARRNEPPPHAAMPDPPPPPSREHLAVHRALTLLNIASSYASEHLEGTLLARRMEASRRLHREDHPALLCFEVESQGQIRWESGCEISDPDAVVRAAAAWIRHLFEALERVLPGRFSLDRLQAMSEAVHDDLANVGLLEALGLASHASDPSPETSSRARTP